MQQVLFHELDDVRRDRQALIELQTRIAAMTTEQDQALTEALSSTFDYFRAGGQ